MQSKMSGRMYPDSITDPQPGPSHYRPMEDLPYDLSTNTRKRTHSSSYYEPSLYKKSSMSPLYEGSNVSFRNLEPLDMSTKASATDSPIAGCSSTSTSSQVKSKNVLPLSSRRRKLIRKRSRPSHQIALDGPQDLSLECSFSDDSISDVIGDKSVDDAVPQVNYFERLPIHLLEQILCQIPYPELAKFRLVCRLWNNIISEKKFMEWQKAYYLYRRKNEFSDSLQTALDESFSHITVTTTLISIVQFMGEKYCRRPSLDMMERLQQTHNFTAAKEVIWERFTQEYVLDNPWSMVAMMVILSESVDDITDILEHLLRRGTRCHLHDVVDALFCIATFLLYFRINYSINHGLHYRVFSALHEYLHRIPMNFRISVENVMSEDTSGLGPSEEYCLTQEQLEFLKHQIEPGQMVALVGVAGTGKTSTVIHYAALHQEMKFLFMRLNESGLQHSNMVFPPNMKCCTPQLLYYESVGKNYFDKMCAELTVEEINPYIDKHLISSNDFPFAECVKKTIENFAETLEDDITINNVPRVIKNITLSIEQLLLIVDQSKMIWAKIADWNMKDLRLTHSMYMKLLQLSRPNLQEYNCIIIDDAENWSPLMMDTALSQSLPLILVIDENQDLNCFGVDAYRTIPNALAKIKITHKYKLTQSFRFGPEIAYVANCCLEVIKKTRDEMVIGSNKKSYVDGTAKGSYAIIARTSSRLLKEVMRLVCTENRFQHEPVDVKGALLEAQLESTLDEMVDLYRLSVGGKEKKKITNKFLLSFNNFDDLVCYSLKSGITELSKKLDFIRKFGKNLLTNFSRVKEKCSYSVQSSNIIFVTADNARGLEFDTVCLLDDFPVKCIGTMRRPTMVDVAEGLDPLYVAVTRAKKCLIMSESLHKVLTAAQEKFEYPKLSTHFLVKTSTLKCSHCGKDFVPHTVLVNARSTQRLASQRIIPYGPMCMHCGVKPRFRPGVLQEPAFIILDSVEDFAHQSMLPLLGPLPADSPLMFETEDVYQFGHDREAVIFRFGM